MLKNESQFNFSEFQEKIIPDKSKMEKEEARSIQELTKGLEKDQLDEALRGIILITPELIHQITNAESVTSETKDILLKSQEALKKHEIWLKKATSEKQFLEEKLKNEETNEEARMSPKDIYWSEVEEDNFLAGVDIDEKNLTNVSAYTVKTYLSNLELLSNDLPSKIKQLELFIKQVELSHKIGYQKIAVIIEGNEYVITHEETHLTLDTDKKISEKFESLRQEFDKNPKVRAMLREIYGFFEDKQFEEYIVLAYMQTKTGDTTDFKKYDIKPMEKRLFQIIDQARVDIIKSRFEKGQEMLKEAKRIID